MSKKSSQEEKSWGRCLRFLNNSSKNTQANYITAINHYQEFHGITMEELVREALDEQTNKVAPHLLKVIDRIEEFQEHLIKQGYVHGVISLYVGKIKTIYRKNRVVLPYLEPLNPKRTNRRPIIEFKDVLTKEELKKAISMMRLPMKARAITQIQGGLSQEECEHLEFNSFIDELKQYHQKDDFVEALEWLADENNPVIWVTKLTRIKTGKPYYAMIGSEAINMIASAKLEEYYKKGYCMPKLLNTNKISFNRTCSRINDKLGLGKVGGENKLKPHNLRRFHATYISGSALNYEEQSIISNSEIDEMQGRGKTGVQDTYIKTNPIRQKTLYAKVMNNVSLWHEYDYEIVDGDVIVNILDPTKLRNEVKKLSRELQKKKEASEKVKKLREELGNDVFEEMIGEILNAS